MIRGCQYCGRLIAPGARRDAVYCGKRCRQAAWRFGRGCPARAPAASPSASSQPKRFAYADPPYPKRAARYYRRHQDYAGEVDVRELVAQLVTEYPDGWALSTSADALQAVLALCPDGVRVAAWVRGERPTASHRPLNAWEPVIYSGGRPYVSERRRLDALVHTARPRTTDPDRVVGAKPSAFAWWLFDLLGALPGDELVDLFPGSGAIGRAWSIYSRAAE